jgi:adenosine deaminase
MPTKAFYTSLEAILRRYLLAIHPAINPSYTAEEIASSLDTQTTLQELLMTCTIGKFDRLTDTSQQRQDALFLAQKYLEKEITDN